MSEAKLFLVPAMLMQEGDGAEVMRLFPLRNRMMNYDPFVLWDNFNLEPGTGFPTHPHRGFEAITYMFTGSMEHRDNLGNASTVTPGGAQRFTAGRGIEHSEMPGGDGYNNGIQLWINLPQHLKTVAPGYQQVDAVDIPVLQENGCEVRVIVGDESPVKLLTPVRYLDIRLQAGGEFKQAVPTDFRGLFYVVKGQVDFVGENIEAGHAVFFEVVEQVDFTASEDAHVMLCMGKPHREPIRQYGPYVD